MIIVKVTGGLGNQMFQYAFYRSLKELYSNTKLDIQYFKYYRWHNGFEIDKIFNNLKTEFANANEINNLSDSKNSLFSIVRRKFFGFKKTHYYEEYLGYNKDIYSDITNKYFDGYWQSEKYFLEIESLIRKEFTFLPFSEDKNVYISDRMSCSNSISIHVRRGDYVNNPLYSGICTEIYYKKAIKYMKENVENPLFFVFSDDIMWCKNNLGLLNQVEYIDWNKGFNSYRDMQLMGVCKHNIIANSTFSWWGAWLNSNLNKIVVAPTKIMNSDNDVIDLIPEKWIKI